MKKIKSIECLKTRDKYRIGDFIRIFDEKNVSTDYNIFCIDSNFPQMSPPEFYIILKEEYSENTFLWKEILTDEYIVEYMLEENVELDKIQVISYSQKIKKERIMDEEKVKNITREELISICEDAVVPFKKWCDRDSYASQININSIYQLLSAGVEYELDLENYANGIYRIEFKNLTKKQIDEASNYNLPIDSREDYFKEFGDDEEMFVGYGIEYRKSDPYLGGYMPTREKLLEVDGKDWY